MFGFGVTLNNINLMIAETRWRTFHTSAPRITFSSWSDIFHYKWWHYGQFEFYLYLQEIPNSVCICLHQQQGCYFRSELFAILIHNTTSVPTHYSFITRVIVSRFCTEGSYEDGQVIFHSLKNNSCFTSLSVSFVGQ